MAAEKTYENKIKRYITDHGGWVIKYFANRMTKSGVPDLLACINGMFVAIEVKAQNGKASELQIYNVEQIRKAGGIAIVLYPNQFAEFKRLVDAINDANTPVFMKQFEFDREVRT